MAQTLFSRIVSIKLPLAVPTQLSHVDDFELGKVFISSKKPPRFRPQKNEDLKYTGVSLTSLLEESSMKDFKIVSSTSVEFVASKDDSLNLNFDLSSESSLTKALTELQFPIKDAKHATLTADLGKVKCLKADLLYSCSTKNLHVKLDHPTIKDAMATSSSLFVITSIYQGDRCHLNVSLGETQKEIVSRDKKTVIAYLLMKLSFDSSGVLTPMLNTGRLSVLERHSPKKLAPSSESDTFNEADKTEINPAACMKGQIEAEESLNIPGWVLVDVISSKENIPEEDPEKNVKQKSEATGVLSGTQPVVEEAVVSKATDLTSAPNPAVDMLPQDVPQQPNISEPELNQRYIYSLKDFQPFESMTYNGIHTEVQQWIKPVVSNKALHSVFLEYTVPPHTVEKLTDLSQYLLVYGKALRDHKTTPVNSKASIEPVLSALTVEWAAQLDEVSSLIIVCEALREFPQHIIKKACQLPAEKVSILVDLVRSTPYGGDKHVYMDEGPFYDPDLNPFMTRMGFSVPPPSNKLVLDLSHEENEDRLAAGMILLLASQPQ